MSIPVIAAWADAAIFVAAGVINLLGARPVRDVYERWDIPAGFYRTLGLVELLTAVLLAAPETRFWGIILAAPIIFGSVVILLDHRQYLFAVSAMGMMAALLATTLAVAPARAPIRFATVSTTPIAAEIQQLPTVRLSALAARPANS